MGKIIPLKCNGCGRTVGAVRSVTENEEGLSADMDHRVEAHAEDCPMMAVLAREGTTLTGISIGPYEDASQRYDIEKIKGDDQVISANIFLNEGDKE